MDRQLWQARGITAAMLKSHHLGNKKRKEEFFFLKFNSSKGSSGLQIQCI